MDNVTEEDIQAAKKAQELICKNRGQIPAIRYDMLHQPAQGKEEKDREASLGDYYQMVAAAAAIYGFFFKAKWVAWVCLFMFYYAIINYRFDVMYT